MSCSRLTLKNNETLVIYIFSCVNVVFPKADPEEAVSYASIHFTKKPDRKSKVRL